MLTYFTEFTTDDYISDFAATKKWLKEQNMTQLLKSNEEISFSNLIVSIEWCLIDDRHCKVWVTTTTMLNKSELNQLRDWVEGQCEHSDLSEEFWEQFKCGLSNFASGYKFDVLRDKAYFEYMEINNAIHAEIRRKQRTILDSVLKS